MFYGYGILNNHVPTLRASMKGGSSSSTLSTSLYAVYKAESNANDSLGTYNGTAQGGLTYTTGKSGNAFTFNGTNSYVSLPDNQFNFTGDFTISAWVNLTDFVSSGSIFGNYTYSGGLDYGYQFFFDKPTNSLAIAIHTGASTIVLRTFGLYTNGVWYHVVVTRKASTGSKIYVNGSLNVSNTSIINPIYTTTHRPSIGVSKYNSTQFQYFLNGKVDETNIWNKELTATEVTDLYNTGTGKFYPY